MLHMPYFSRGRSISPQAVEGLIRRAGSFFEEGERMAKNLITQAPGATYHFIKDRLTKPEKDLGAVALD